MQCILIRLALSALAMAGLLCAEEPVKSAANWELYKDLIIPAGKSLSLPSKIDFSFASAAAVTVRCTGCDTLALSLEPITLQAFWSVPGAEMDAVAEAKSGGSFPYFDSGGVAFQVYGPQLRLVVRNRSKQDFMVHQLTIFRRAPRTD
jgi:hypothetical protein